MSKLLKVVEPTMSVVTESRLPTERQATRLTSPATATATTACRTCLDRAAGPGDDVRTGPPPAGGAASGAASRVRELAKVLTILSVVRSRARRPRQAPPPRKSGAGYHGAQVRAGASEQWYPPA